VSAGSVLAVAHGALLQGHAVVVGSWGALAGAAEPAPSPSPTSIEIPPEDQTSPGLLGFLVTFVAAAAVIGLAFSMVRHLRVVDRNARRLEAAEAGERAAAGGPAPDVTGPGAAPGAGPDAAPDPGARPPRDRG